MARLPDTIRRGRAAWMMEIRLKLNMSLKRRTLGRFPDMTGIRNTVETSTCPTFVDASKICKILMDDQFASGYSLYKRLSIISKKVMISLVTDLSYLKVRFSRPYTVLRRVKTKTFHLGAIIGTYNFPQLFCTAAKFLTAITS